jgi:hypothetical protein
LEPTHVGGYCDFEDVVKPAQDAAVLWWWLIEW